MKAAFLVATLALIGVWVWAGGAPSSPARHLLLDQVVAKPIKGGGGVGLLAIDNQGPPDRLIAVSSPLADVSLYSPVSTDGLPLQTGTSSLALDAAHIRISQPDRPLADGVLVPLTLTFANAGQVSVKARLADPAQQGNAAQVGLFGLGDICLVGEGEPAPKLALSTVSSGDGWQVQIDAEDFTFSKELLGMYHVPGMGHGHIYVGGMKLGRIFAPEFQIGALPKGRHEVRVTLNTNDHRAYVVEEEPVTASAVIVVD